MTEEKNNIMKRAGDKQNKVGNKRSLHFKALIITQEIPQKLMWDENGETENGDG